MEDWEGDDDLGEVTEVMATTKGKVLSLECLECGEVFFGYDDEFYCPVCTEGDSLLQRILTKTVGDDEAEDKFFEYRCIEYERGWLRTKIESNVNLPAPNWLEELHAIMKKRGMLKPYAGGWKWDYPETLGDYMRFLTVIAADSMRPYHQVCCIVRFWKTEFKYVRLTVIEDGKYKEIDHCGPWSKWMKWGKEEVEITFNPFHPIFFQCAQPSNKGFRELIDVWRNTKEGGVDALIQIAADEVFNVNKK